MPYTGRPFNPNTPYENQVETELELANENFDILRQAFVSDNPETFIVKQADKVDGFDASLLPAPNTIPVAGVSGKLDIGWLPDEIGGYGYKRVDLTNATTDYNLQLGEEAYYVWNTSSNLNRPLRIQVSGSLYQIYVMTNYTSGTAPFISLNPNNTTYSSAFLETRIYTNTLSSSTNTLFITATRSAIVVFPMRTCSMLLQTTTPSKMAHGFYVINRDIHIFYTYWNNTSTAWSSLGTLTSDRNIGTVYVLVRRIL